MRMFRLPLLLFAVLALTAWDTRVVEGDIWRSTYSGGKSASIAEHSTLADMALERIGLADIYGREGRAEVTVVDLNATYFREESMRDTAREGDNDRTRVEERLLPQPARFAGLPDYSYGPSDWLNKNLTCPIGGPAEDDGLCHAFKGWLGGLNAVHFGTQATRMYARYHTLALDQAGRARRLRAQMTPDERRAYAGALKEAEHLALVYEGYAQHFLQDRWAIGHMWERWDGPDRTQIANPSSRTTLMIGAVAGLIHGHEAVANERLDKGWGLSADPMSSPLRGETAARPMTFRHVSDPDRAPVPAVGDERLEDMTRGAFGKGYGGPNTDQPLDVRQQQGEMLTCSAAGWAEVVRALGPGEGGGYGAFNARLSPDAPDFAILLQQDCWDMWATNRSVYIGLAYLGIGDDTGRTLVALTLLRPVENIVLPGVLNIVDESLLGSGELTVMGWRMWRRQWLDPDGTDLARGGIGPLWNAPSGDKADLPIYAEPLDPAALPFEARGGVDRQTLFGALSLAHADYWGGVEGLDTLERLRRSDRPELQQACQYVADMAWQGTHPSYEGPMARTRKADADDVRSLAGIQGGRREAGADDPRDPFYIDQGYVSRREDRDRAPTFGSKSAANWCARLPVVRLSRDAGLRNANIVQVLPADARRIELFGENFGGREGRVLFFEDGRPRRDRGRIVDWRDNRIQIDFRPGELKAGRDHLIEVRTDDGRRSVGLFIVRVRPADDPDPAPPPVASGCDAAPPSTPVLSLGADVARDLGGDVLNTDPAALARAIRAGGAKLATAQAPLRAFLGAERACLLKDRPGGMAVIDRTRREGRQAATRESADWFEAFRAEGRSGGSWVKHCAASSGGPVRFALLAGGTPFVEPDDFWLAYVDELDGVVQYGRFAETFIAAWALALEREGPPLAPDPALRGDGYDLRIRDPAVVLARYFRPLKSVGDLERRLWQVQALREVDLWAQSSLALYDATARGVVSRRDYETWLVSGLRSQAKDPIDALCRTDAALARPPAEGFYSPDGAADRYRAADGRSYARIGWPAMTALPSGLTERAPPGATDGPGPSAPQPFTPQPFVPQSLPTIPVPPRVVPLRRRRRRP